ncbi:EamA family transporter [Parabacteroides sp. AF19-14]|uniref:EamA family transporter n=1 Tax=Parabacteroides sp. AF19-14 TaxID=2293114 RepID=UPI000F00DBBA|nr:EamA family transporter [Parabacteroides sp. AF19-14]RKU58980.1 EamA family transporter [Parabacteroides sp. AF19-14]
MILTSVAVISRVLSNPLGNVFQKQLTNRYNHPLLINFLTFLLLSVFCIIPAIQVRWLELPFEFWKYCILAGIVGATGNGFLVKALQCGDLSVLGPINSYKSVVGIIVGIFLLGEIPNLWGIAEVHLVKEFKRIKIRDLFSYFYLVLCIGTMQYTTNYVFDHMEVGYALALFQLSTIVSIFLGYRIFKEENITKKLIGSVIMVAGSVMIILLK